MERDKIVRRRLQPQPAKRPRYEYRQRPQSESHVDGMRPMTRTKGVQRPRQLLVFRDDELVVLCVISDKGTLTFPMTATGASNLINKLGRCLAGVEDSTPCVNEPATKMDATLRPYQSNPRGFIRLARTPPGFRAPTHPGFYPSFPHADLAPLHSRASAGIQSQFYRMDTPRRKPARRPVNGVPKPEARSRISNGKDLLPGIDGRSLIARRYRDISSAILVDQGGDPAILVAQAPSRVMNPSLPQSVVDRAMERDQASAEAEYGAQFRRAHGFTCCRWQQVKQVKEGQQSSRLPVAPAGPRPSRHPRRLIQDDRKAVDLFDQARQNPPSLHTSNAVYNIHGNSAHRDGPTAMRVKLLTM